MSALSLLFHFSLLTSYLFVLPDGGSGASSGGPQSSRRPASHRQLPAGLVPVARPPLRARLPALPPGLCCGDPSHQRPCQPQPLQAGHCQRHVLPQERQPRRWWVAELGRSVIPGELSGQAGRAGQTGEQRGQGNRGEFVGARIWNLFLFFRLKSKVLNIYYKYCLGTPPIVLWPTLQLSWNLDSWMPLHLIYLSRDKGRLEMLIMIFCYFVPFCTLNFKIVIDNSLRIGQLIQRAQHLTSTSSFNIEYTIHMKLKY